MMDRESRMPVVSRTGLTSAQVEQLRGEYGPNELKGKRKIRPVLLFFSQFKDILTLILVVSTVFSVLLGEIMEAYTILAIIFLNAILGFIQEYRTEKTMEALQQMAAPMSSVIRDGKQQSVPSSTLVPGDLVLLEAGAKVPADLSLLESTELSADESLLTGESQPVPKQAGAQGDHQVYMGTSVTSGRGIGQVTAIGMETQMGHIADLLRSIPQEDTPLQRKLSQLGKYIGIGCLVICLLVTVTGVLRGLPLYDMILTGLSLAVAAVPEGLPTIVTVALALAVSRMLKKNALIRKMHSVETLGCANVICSDKTGTLTENKMTVKELCLDGKQIQVGGAGYEKKGEFTCQGSKVVPYKVPVLEKLLQVAVLCNNAHLYTGRQPGQWEVSGDGTDAALLVLAAKAGITEQSLSGFQRCGEIPFSSGRKRMGVYVADAVGREQLLVKGAPDLILARCTHRLTSQGIVPLTARDMQDIQEENGEMADRALRVLGFAYRDISLGTRQGEEELIFIGLAGMVDPPRKEAAAAVERCRRAGIRTVMITGDHKRTAAAIATQVGVYRPGDLCYTGSELDEMGDETFEKAVTKASVFARVNPEHKLRIVRELKRQGNVVAMTGDGVNDAPAVKEADIGVAMGMGGTDVTKEAASIILLDDNFSTLTGAVEEGRVIYQNIRKFIRYLLSCNIGEVVTMFFGMLMGLPVVLGPIQILMVNLVTDGLPAICLGLDPSDGDVMKKMPRKKDEGVFSNGLSTRILIRGFLIGFCTLGAFVSVYRYAGNLTAARTAAFLTLVMTQLIHVFECKSEEKPLFRIPILNNGKLLAACLFSAAVVFACIYLPVLQPVFQTAPLGLEELGIVLGFLLLGPILSLLSFWGIGKKKRAGTDKEEGLQMGTSVL